MKPAADTRKVAFRWMVAILLLAGCGPAEPTRSSAPAKTAILAGGCYWCMEPAFDHLEGVVSVRAGYGGEGEESREAVDILYDPSVVTYDQLLDHFWRNIDPFDDGGQFCDRGREYRSAIFVAGAGQADSARRSLAQHQARFEREIVTRIIPSSTFRPAIESEQDYYRKHPVRYRFYRINCGRDARLAEVWGE